MVIAEHSEVVMEWKVRDMTCRKQGMVVLVLCIVEQSAGMYNSSWQVWWTHILESGKG